MDVDVARQRPGVMVAVHLTCLLRLRPGAGAVVGDFEVHAVASGDVPHQRAGRGIGRGDAHDRTHRRRPAGEIEDRCRRNRQPAWWRRASRRPVSVQPVPSKLPALSPGINVYQFESCAEPRTAVRTLRRNIPTCRRATSGRLQRGRSLRPVPRRRDRDRRPGEVLHISSQHLPSVVVLAAEPSRTLSRPLALRPRLAPGLPFSAFDRWVYRPLAGRLSARRPARRMLDSHIRPTSSSLVHAWPIALLSMSIEPNLEEQQLLEDTLRRTGAGLTNRELLAESWRRRG